MNRRYIHAFIVSVVLSAGISAVHAMEFAGGTGTYGDPYQIGAPDQLVSLRSDPNLLDKCFVLICDIDLADRVFRDAVIGPFAGVFDGAGFRIRNLTVTGGSGLFESINAAGEVRNLILEDVLVLVYDGPLFAGSLTAVNGGTISRCSVSGTLMADGLAGGMVSINVGLIEECRSLCTISARTAGGLVLSNKGRIRDCYAAGHLLAEFSGGFAYDNAYSISRCYSVSRIESTVSAEGNFLNGTDCSWTKPKDCYFLDPLGGETPTSDLGVPLTGAQMRQRENFVGWDFEGVGDDGGSDTWFLPEDGYPELSWLGTRRIPRVAGLAVEEACKLLEEAGFRVGRMVYDYDHVESYGHAITTHPFPAARPGSDIDVVLGLGPYEWSSNIGTGDVNSPYQILTEGQLDCLAHRADLWDRCFELVADIDMEGRIYAGALIGRSDFSEAPFNGVFNGGGHIIRNLTIGGYSTDANQATVLGFFGETGLGARVLDLGLADVSIMAAKRRSGNGGMLCAVNGGYIGRCYSVGRLRMRGQLGGLVGGNTGVIEDCYVRGEVEEMPQRGSGLYAGLVADNASGTIRTCYSVSAVALIDGNGLVASNDGGTVQSCFWDVEASGANKSDGGVGLKTQELMNGWTLRTQGWGGNPNWVLDEGKDYPRLIWEGTPGNPIPAISVRR